MVNRDDEYYEDGYHHPSINESFEYFDQKIKTEQMLLERDEETYLEAMDRLVELSLYMEYPTETSIRTESFIEIDEVIESADNFLKTVGEPTLPKIRTERNIVGYVQKVERIIDVVTTVINFLTKIVKAILKRLAQVAIYMYRKIRKTFGGYSKKLMQQANEMNGKLMDIKSKLSETDLDTFYEIFGKKGSKFKDLKMLTTQEMGGTNGLGKYLTEMISLDAPLTFLDSVKRAFGSVITNAIVVENTESLNNKMREAANKQLKASGPKSAKLEPIKEAIAKSKGKDKNDLIVCLFGVKKIHYWRWTNESYSHPPAGKIESIAISKILEEPEYNRDTSAATLFGLAEDTPSLLKYLDGVEGKIVSSANKIKNRIEADAKAVTTQIKKYVSKDSNKNVKKNVQAFVKCYSLLGTMSGSKQINVTYDNIYWVYNILKKVTETTYATYLKANAAQKGASSLNS